MFEIIPALVVGIVVLGIIAKVVTLPFRILWKCIVNSVTGAIILAVLKYTILTSLQINFFTALIAGIFGVPGVIAIIIYSYM